MVNMNFLMQDVIQLMSGKLTTFSRGGGTKIKSKQFSEFGSRTIFPDSNCLPKINLPKYSFANILVNGLLYRKKDKNLHKPKYTYNLMLFVNSVGPQTQIINSFSFAGILKDSINSDNIFLSIRPVRPDHDELG